MKWRIGIFFGLFAIALTIAGSAADGDTTSAAAEVAAPSGPEAVAIERDANSGNSGEFKCYKYACGKKVNTAEHGVAFVKCEEIPKETTSCGTGITTCKWEDSKGRSRLLGPLDQVAGECAKGGSPKSGCVDEVLVNKGGFNGTTKTCHCSTPLCNGPFAFTSSVPSPNPSDFTSSVSSKIPFVSFAALLIAVMINIF